MTWLTERTFQGRHAVVTGGGTGIGAAIARELSAAGASLSLLGRRADKLRGTADTCTQPSHCQVLPCDVTSEDEVKRTFASATENFGTVNILINAAGSADAIPFHKLDLASFQSVLDTNLKSVFLCSLAVINDMRSQRLGRIINIASTAALTGYAYVSAYAAAKHGVLGLTRSLALEVAEFDITVNALCPGYTDTDIVRSGVERIRQSTGRKQAEAEAVFTSASPQQRLMTPGEIAACALWLCSDAAHGITGQAISISGGEVM